MPKICYEERRFGDRSLAVIVQANRILEEYQRQGFTLTLRQLYYQFVARDLVPNRQTEYKRLGEIVNDARMAGLIDWDYIIDRTRNLVDLPHWNSPSDIARAAAQSYRRPKWAVQPRRVEVWIEKDAAVGIVQGVCQRLDIPYFSCRGYTSQSEMWAAGRRLAAYRAFSVDYERRAGGGLERVESGGQDPLVLHLGDHDPSGIQMTEDIENRLGVFAEGPIEIRRLALNMDQIDLYDPPPNPAKLTDSRAQSYISRFGMESWELDALEPRVVEDLIRTAVDEVLDLAAWDREVERERIEREQLKALADNWDDLADTLDEYVGG
jgi:hypothetical protein